MCSLIAIVKLSQIFAIADLDCVLRKIFFAFSLEISLKKQRNNVIDIRFAGGTRLIMFLGEKIMFFNKNVK